MGGDFSKKPAFHQHENTRITCSTYPGCILSNSVQDRLNIRRRTGDDTQNFTRGCLLFQRLLEFVEQAHILDGDHRLIGKRFEKLDLFLRKRANLRPTDHDRPDRNTLTQQWRGEYGPYSDTSGKGRSKVTLWFCCQVMNVNGFTINHTSARNIPPVN